MALKSPLASFQIISCLQRLHALLKWLPGWQPNSPHWCLGSWLDLLISNIYRELITLLCFWTLGKLLPIIHSVFSWWQSTHEGNIWLFSCSVFHCVHQPASGCVSLLFGVERDVYGGIISLSFLDIKCEIVAQTLFLYFLGLSWVSCFEDFIPRQPGC